MAAEVTTPVLKNTSFASNKYHSISQNPKNFQDIEKITIFPNRNFITMKEQKIKKKYQKFTGKRYY